MRCFEKYDAHATFENRKQQLKQEIRDLSAEDLDKTDRNEWVDYWQSKYEVVPVTIYPETADIDVQEKTVQTYNTWYQLDRSESKYFDVAGLEATCKVAYSGTAWFFEMRPSMFTLCAHEAERVSSIGENGIGYITFCVEIPLGSATSDGIQKHFADKIEDFSTQISYCNADAEKYNASLLQIIETEIDKRIEQVDKYALIRKGLNLPLNRIEGAPYAVPIPIKKKKIKANRPAKSTNGEPSYAISEEVYAHINEVVESTCVMMERTPSAYSTLEEEQIRDILLTTLNSHYEDLPTGETFRKHGKADIHIPIEKHAAYIAECKIWHGRKAFGEALSQLFSYTTWRDTKVSIVVFNKKNKNFEKILSEISNSLEELSISPMQKSHNRWQCKIQNEVDGRIMHVNVQVFDLSC